MKLVPVRVPGTMRFTIKMVELGNPEERKSRKTKMEKRRIRKRYERVKAEQIGESSDE